MLCVIQTLPVFGQISSAIDQGLDLTGDTVSNLVDDTVPIEGAGQLTRDGFGILKAIYQVMKQVHYFITALITMITTEGMSEEEASKMAGLIGFGSIIATIIIGLRILKGVWRHFFLVGIIIFLVILGASFLGNEFNLNL